MAEPAADLRARLRPISPEAARRRNTLLALFNGAPTPLGPLSVAVDERPAGAPSLAFKGGFGATPLLVEGAPAAWLARPETPVLPEALAELARLEPLLAAAERRLGVPLEPSALAAPAPGAVRLRLSVSGEAGGERHALAFDVPSALSLPRPPAPTLRDLERLGGAVVRLRLEAFGRPAPLGELAQLAAGDLLLVDGDARGLAARLAGAGGFAIVGRWRPQDGRFAAGDA